MWLTFEKDRSVGSSGDAGRLLKTSDLLAQSRTRPLTLGLRWDRCVQGYSRHWSLGDCSGNEGVRMELPGEMRRMEPSMLGRSCDEEEDEAKDSVAMVVREAFAIASEKGASKSSWNRGLRGPTGLRP